jgi:chromosomal replication initiation ATPase DnaA
MKKNTKEPIPVRIGYVNPYAFSITELKKKSKNMECIVREAVLKAFETEWDTINVKERRIGLLMPRHAYFYFMRRMTGSAEYSLSKIGAIMRRGHATVINSIKVWENLRETNVMFSEIHDEIQKHINNRLNNTSEDDVEQHAETIANWSKFKRKYEWITN